MKFTADSVKIVLMLMDKMSSEKILGSFTSLLMERILKKMVVDKVDIKTTIEACKTNKITETITEIKTHRIMGMMEITSN